jgi:hypothetical protein
VAEKLVTIAQFADYIQADLARQLLDDYEIKSVVTGQNVANVYSGLPALTDVELQTFESLAQQALEILESQKKQEQ